MTNFSPFTLSCVQTFLVILNVIGSTYRAYFNSHYSFLAFILFVYFGAFLIYYLSSIYRSLPPKHKSLEKSLLGFTIWFLVSSIIFGFVYQFYPLFGFWTSLPINVIAIIGSGITFYDYVICDSQEENNGNNWRSFGSNDQVKKSYCGEKWEVTWEEV